MPDGEEEGRKFLEPDLFVEKLAPDPAQPAEGTRFVGFLGKSTRSGYWRLYLDATLRDYLEIAEEDILVSDRLSAALSPMGGSLLIVRSDAQIVRNRVSVSEARNAFLRGGISSQHLRGSMPQVPGRRTAALGGGGVAAHTDDGFWCDVSHWLGCATHHDEDPMCGTPETVHCVIME